MAVDEPTRKEIVEYLVLNEGVTDVEANDCLDVMEMAEQEEPGSSAELMGHIMQRMRTARLAALVKQIAAIDPAKATAANVMAVKRIAARAVADSERR